MIYETHCSQHTYYFNIFKCSFSECLCYINLLGEPIQTFPDPITYTKPTEVENYKVGKDSTKRKTSIPFLTSIHSFKCKNIHLLYKLLSTNITLSSEKSTS